MTLSGVALDELIKLRRNASKYHPTLAKFANQFKGLCIDTFLVWILFLFLGVPTVVKYGYSVETDRHKLDLIPKSTEGSIASGVYGSGVFPYTLFLFIVATTFFIKELYCFFQNPSIREMERRVDEMMISSRMGSMRQMSTIHKEDMMSIGTEAASLNPID